MSNSFMRVSISGNADDARQLEQDKKDLERLQPSEPRNVFESDTVSVGHVGNIESARIPAPNEVLADIPDERIDPFPDTETMANWIEDPRYRTSAAYRSIVERRIAKTPF